MLPDLSINCVFVAAHLVDTMSSCLLQQEQARHSWQFFVM